MKGVTCDSVQRSALMNSSNSIMITHRLESNEAAIHRLVDDILAHIFFLNATVPEPDVRKHATTVASSQVCMRWRTIALQCHAIWGLSLIILDILSSGLRHYWIAHIPHRWILVVG